MREFCLLTKSGTVINMAMCYDGAVPGLTAFQQERGYYWEPATNVSPEALHAYYYYDHRP